MTPRSPGATPARRRRRWPRPLRRSGPAGWRRPEPLPSERHVAVLAMGQLFALGAQEVESGAQLAASLRRIDHVVDEATLGGLVGVREPVRVLLDQLRAEGGRISRRLQLSLVEDVDRA